MARRAPSNVLFNRVRLSLHQKLMEPSAPPVANVPCTLNTIQFTGYRKVSFRGTSG